MPGFIDMHVHLTGETQKQVDALRDTLTLNPADYAYRSVALAERTLMAKLYHRARPGRGRWPERGAQARHRQRRHSRSAHVHRR
ncbi:hypothetical protein LP420_23135 [Massilia sp. B-10]|nr:hypothetical protein LP420_23135 [Massilia sp. B-10]